MFDNIRKDFKSWSSYEKISLWITLVFGIVGLISSGSYISIEIQDINQNNNIGNNLNLISSNSNQITQVINNNFINNNSTFLTKENDKPCFNYVKEIGYQNNFMMPKDLNQSINNNEYKPYYGVSFYNVKLILPDRSEAFLTEFLFNQTYFFGECNEEVTDCRVYNKYKDIPKAESICLTIDLGKVNKNFWESLQLGDNFKYSCVNFTKL